jgi:hypothetical protein
MSRHALIPRQLRPHQIHVIEFGHGRLKRRFFCGAAAAQTVEL